MSSNSYSVIEVDINEILPNRFQPRIQFDEEEILELSDSIKEHGVIQPIVVRTIGNKYEIIAGERRYKASVLAGKETVPVIIKNLNDKDSAEIALIENIQRKNLTTIEEALSYKKILDMGYLTQENLANKLGKSQSSVANKIRLLNLSDEVQEALLDNKISERHARSLLRLKSITDQNDMLEKIINDRLTVRKTDEEIDKILKLSKEEIKENVEKKEYNSEKGEINMNNNMNQIPTITLPSNNNGFDIFGGSTPTAQLNEPNNIQIPTIQPIMPSAPVAPAVPEIPSIPVVEPKVEMPQIGGMQFDNNGNVISMGMPSAPVAPAVPEVPPIGPGLPGYVETNVIEDKIPEMSPIIDSFQNNSELLNSTNLNQSNLINQSNEPSVMNNSIGVPQPIIITDYNKQYDPVMPNFSNVVEPKVDFKEVVNTIRECSKKIEQYGYRIDVEEYDLSTLYQVVFKIEK